MSEWIPLAKSGSLPAVCGIYIIKHVESGKLYVGKSVNVRRRMYDHRSAKSPHYLHRAVRKHGIDAFVIRLHAVGTEAQMTALEVLLIAYLGCMVPAGYNGTIGGDGASGARHTDEMRLRNSARQRGVPKHDAASRQRLSEMRLANNPFRGKTHTAEALAKMGAAAVALHTGRKRSTETLARMSAALKGHRGRTYTEEDRRKISESLKGRPAPWASRPGEANPMFGLKGADSPNARRVAAWLPESMVPHVVFDTAGEAAVWAGAKVSSVSDWCAGRYRPKNGMLWAYV